MSVGDLFSRALIKSGRQMTLRRMTLGPGGQQIPLDVTVYGATVNYSADELNGGIVQGDTAVKITNKEIAAAQWPGPPKPGDKFIIDGKTRNIGPVEPKYDGTEVVAFVCQVTG